MIKKRLVGLLAHGKKYIALKVLWQWLALISQIIAVFNIAGLLEKVYLNQVVKQDLIGTAITLVVCVIARMICDKQAVTAGYKASVDVKKILRKNIYEKMLRLGASYRDKVATSEVMQVSTEGVEQLEIYFGKYLPQMFFSLLAPITLFVVLAPINLKSSIVLLICVPLIPLSIVAVQKLAKRLLNKYWSIYTGLGDSFLENLQGLTTLKIYQADGDKTQQMDREAENFRRITMKVLTMQLNSISVMDIVAYGGAAVGMIVAVLEFIGGNISLAGTLTIVLLASEFFIPLRLLGSFFHIAMNGMAASDKIFNILDLEEPKDGTVTLNQKNAEKLNINIEDLHFSYDGDREILAGINMEIPEKTFISIVGKSGCGKSTITGLLAGRNKGYTGKIQVGNLSLTDIKERSLMETIVQVGHNSYLFKGTVRENLLIVNPTLDDQKLEKVLETVNLLGFLNEQEGLDTKLQENGSNLSGGQRQRLAIARALLKDAPIYIFDEATSNIDVESEELIMQVIEKLAKEKTVILISHRLANVVDSDKIYFMAEGQVKESGTHNQLMNLKGEYEKLYSSQHQLELYGKEALV